MNNRKLIIAIVLIAGAIAVESKPSPAETIWISEKSAESYAKFNIDWETEQMQLANKPNKNLIEIFVFLVFILTIFVVLIFYDIAI